MSWLKSYADSALSAASHLTNDLLQANAARRSRDGDFDRGDYYVDSGPPGPHRNSDARDEYAGADMVAWNEDLQRELDLTRTQLAREREIKDSMIASLQKQLDEGWRREKDLAAKLQGGGSGSSPTSGSSPAPAAQAPSQDVVLLQEKLSKAATHLKSLNARNNELAEKLQASQERERELEEKLNAAPRSSMSPQSQTDYSYLKDHAAGLEKLLEEAAETEDQLRSEIDELRGQLRAAKTAREPGAADDLVAESNAESKLAELHRELESLSAKIVELESDNGELMRQLDEATTGAAAAQDARTEVDRVRAEVEGKLRDLEEKHARDVDEAVSKAVEDAEKRHNAILDELADSQNVELEALGATLAQTRAELEATRSKIIDTSSASADQAAVEAANEALAAANDQISKLQERVEELIASEKELNDLRDTVANLEGALAEARKAATPASPGNDRAKALESQLAEAADRQADLEADVEDLTLRLDKAQQAHRDELESLSAKLDEASRERVEAEGELENLRGEIETLRSGGGIASGNGSVALLRAAERREEELRAEIEILRAELEQQGRTGGSGEEMEQLQLREAELEGEIDSLRAALEAAEREKTATADAAEWEKNELVDEIENLRAETEALRRKLEASANENSATFERLRSELDSIGIEKQRLEDETVALREELATLRSNAEAGDGEVMAERQRLESELETLDREKRGLSDQVAAQAQRIEALRTEFDVAVEDKMNEMEGIRSELEGVLREKETLAAQIATLHDEINLLRDQSQSEAREKASELERLRTELETVDHAKEELAEQTTALRKELEEQHQARASADERAAELEHARLALSSEMEALRVQLESLRAQTQAGDNEKDAELSRLGSELEAARQARRDLTSEISALLGELEDLRVSSAADAERARGAEEVVSGLQNELEALRHQQSTTATELDSMRAMLDQARTEQTTSNDSLAVSERRISELEAEIESLQASTRSVENAYGQELEMEKMRASAAETRVGELAAELESVKAELLAAGDERTAALETERQQLAAARQREAELEAEIATLRASLEAADKERSHELEASEDRIAAAENRRVALEAEVSKLTAELAVLSDRAGDLDAVQEELNTARQHEQAMEAEIRSLRQQLLKHEVDDKQREGALEAELESLKDQVASLTEQLDSSAARAKELEFIQEQLAMAEAREGELRMEVKTLTSKVESGVSERDGEVAAAKRELDEARQREEELRAEIDAMNKAVEELEETRAREQEVLGQRLNKATRHESELQAQVESLKELLAAADSERMQVVEETSQLAGEVEALRSRLMQGHEEGVARSSQLELQLQEAQMALKSTQETVVALEEQLSSLSASKAEEAAALRRELENETACTAGLEAEVASLCEQLELNVKRTKELQAQVSELEAVNAELKAHAPPPYSEPEQQQSQGISEAAREELETLREENLKWRGAAEKAGVTLKSLMIQLPTLLNSLASGELDFEAGSIDGVPEPIMAPVRAIAGRLDNERAVESSAATAAAEELAELRDRFEQLQLERDGLAVEHEALMTRMRGLKDGIQNKLQADQDELASLRTRNDELVAQLEHLQQQNAHLASELGTLSSENQDQASVVSGYTSQINELRAANEHGLAENEKLQREIARLREFMMEANDAQTVEQLRLEDTVKEMEKQVSLLMKEREQLEELAHQEKAEADKWKTKIGDFDELKSTLTEERDRWKREYEKQTEAVRNLQLVLEQFQASKDSEISFAVDGLKRQLSLANVSLEEFRTRAVTAEEKLETVSTTGPAVQQLQSELSEKNAVIGKLRHDVLQLQTHLAEAMRRIKEVSDNSNLNVDRRLISNLIVQFMTIPRGDGKRFEILKIIASVLHFNEEEQYRVGLIRRPAGVVGPPTIPNSVAASRRTSMEDPRSPTRGEVQESFTELWIAFLQSQSRGAAGGAGASGIPGLAEDYPPPPIPVPTPPPTAPGPGLFGRIFGSKPSLATAGSGSLETVQE